MRRVRVWVAAHAWDLFAAAVFTFIIAVAGATIFELPWFGVPLTFIGVLIVMAHLARRAP